MQSIESLNSVAKQNRNVNVEKVVLNTLKEMLGNDINMFDIHYIRDRAVEIMEKTIVNHKNKMVENRKARLELLKKEMNDISKSIWNFNSEAKEVRSVLKGVDKKDKEKVLERLNKLERISGKISNDATDDRDIRCEPICQKIAEDLLNTENVLNEKEDSFFLDALEYEDDVFLLKLSMLYVGDLFEKIYFSIDESYLKANEKKWGCVREKIKMKQLDETLKG